MATHVSQAGLPAAEPKDGDFVAYLAEIERQQLRRAASAQAAAPAVGATTAAPGAVQAAARQRLGAAPVDAKAFVGPALLGLVALLFLWQGVLGDAGLIAGAIGAFLAWRAWVALRKAGRSVAPDAAARVVQALRQAQQQARK